VSILQFPTPDTKVRQFTSRFQNSFLALVLMSVCPMSVVAQGIHVHRPAPEQTELTPDQDSLIQIVRDNTERFKNVTVAEGEGYALQFGCVSGPDSGAMGLHFINSALVGSGVIDATRPQAVIYEQLPNGHLQLIGADYLVLADTWNAKHQSPPELNGQLFHLFDTPNRFGLPAFYTLHVWAWKDNPNGAFVNWHPNVSCQNFAGRHP